MRRSVSSAVHLPRARGLGKASDEHLTRLIRLGDRDAFRTLYERHRALVDAIARASSRERAEDIAQETWISVYRALSGPGKPIDHVAPWLATITRNVARDRHRREARHQEVAIGEIVAAAPAPGGVESALDDKHSIGRMLGALEELSEEQQLILHLREFGGLTYRQIAEQLGKPESTVEAALFRARRRIAKEYAELDSGRRCRVVQAQLAGGGQLSPGERRRLSRHLGRCATCERVARLEGAHHLIPAPRRARIAGVIPLPGVLARLLAGGAEGGAPVAVKAVVAAIAVVAGAGGLVAVTRDGAESVPAGAGGPMIAQDAAASSPSPVALAVAPNVVRSARVTAVAKRPAPGGGAAPPRRAQPTTAVSAPGSSTAPAAAKPAPRRVTRPAPTRRERAPATRDPTPPPAPVSSPSAPAAAPAPAPVQQAPAPVAQAPAPAAPAPAAPAPGSGGPSVSQTPTCLVAACRIGG